MTHDLSTDATTPVRVVHARRRRRHAKLAIAAIAAITSALAVPTISQAYLASDPAGPGPTLEGPTEPGSPAPGTSDFGGDSGQASQASTGGNDQAFTGSVTAVAHKTAPADTTVALRRDGTKADPFVANVGGTPITTASDDDFAWGDAAIGAGVALGLIALAGAAGAGLRRNGTYSTRSVPTGS